MTLIEKLGLTVLHRLDPERAHELSIRALCAGLVPLPGPVTGDRLATTLCGMDLPNPIGLAAGYDKNAQALAPLMRAGFGFVECGAATPRPQPGNPRPRLFRLTEDRAAINRFGFNNQGARVIAERMAARPNGIPAGLNIGANKDSSDRAADFAAVIAEAGQAADFVTVNVSSPNTERLRDLQGAEALTALLQQARAARDALPRRIPLFVKIAPDLNDAELADIAAVAESVGVDGIIATNTTLSRDGLRSAHAKEGGGLSGRPVFDRSTRVLARLYRLTDGRLPLIGVGGVASAEDALAKIRAGASAVQVYTALVFAGFSLVTEIARGLDDLLAKGGFTSVEEARGTAVDRWLS